MAGNYAELSKELQERIREDRRKSVSNPYACPDEACIRRRESSSNSLLWRPAFVRDVERIMHIPYFNRYMDKTQVFSLYRNDDITRRACHVQLVSRIARNIGAVLGLNLDLIEAAAIGHDIGHTPFGHPGERKLSELYHADTGRLFHHNIHSARVLDIIFPLNLSLQTLDGIICHNGEMEAKNYHPVSYADIASFDAKMEACYRDAEEVAHLVPATLEACVVRVSDIIAYLGKDRQDAIKLGFIESETEFEDDCIGNTNAEIINNMIVNILENSYGKDHLAMSDEVYAAFSKAKKDNYKQIYRIPEVAKVYEESIDPMFEKIYAFLCRDYREKGEHSVLYRNHIAYITECTRYYKRTNDYREESVYDLAVDYLASMTDDYFVDLYAHLFPDSGLCVSYRGYFDEPS